MSRPCSNFDDTAVTANHSPALMQLRRVELERRIEELIALLDLLDGDENLEPYLADTDPNDEDREEEDEREPEELEENGDEHDCALDEYECSSWNGGARDAATFCGVRCFYTMKGQPPFTPQY